MHPIASVYILDAELEWPETMNVSRSDQVFVCS